MPDNTKFLQSPTSAHITFLGEGEYVVTINNANINGTTCNISAIFPHVINATNWIESFGIESYTTRTLED